MRSIVNILDLSAEEIDRLIAVADDIAAQPEKYNEVCRHKILATLFFEPSTRTRLSFESAMLSLGGQVIGFSGAGSSSASKGETLADTIEVVNGYADIIAMRHPKEGAPVVASMHTAVPLINAGDGGHFHPTQTLADLATLQSRFGRVTNLTVGLCGENVAIGQQHRNSSKKRRNNRHTNGRATNARPPIAIQSSAAAL